MRNNGIKILITTGIYPPKIGGPAQYAQNLKQVFEKMGYKVSVETFNVENCLPSGIRHLFFFLKIIPRVIWSRIVFTLDTFSTALPSVFASKILFKKCVIRTGGDFLWEQYTERTSKKVLLGNFYQTEIPNFSLKDKIIFNLTKWTLNNASHVIFSTDWQRRIFINAYNLNPNKTSVVENYYGQKESDFNPKEKIFITSSRNLILKNLNTLSKVFERIKLSNPNISLFTENLSFGEFMEKIAKSYAVILVSIGDVSPNMILDAIRYNRPFICTREVGIYDRIKDAGVFVNPLNEGEIEKAILNLLTEDGYNKAKEKVKNFNFVHTWNQIAEEFMRVYKSL